MRKAHLLAASIRAVVWAMMLAAPALPEAQATANPPLQSLTVPADRLASACLLTPSDTAQLDIDSVRSGLWGGLPRNPWQGVDDATTISRIREHVAGLARLPDGPPLSKAELARFELQLARVEEGYAAVYGNGGRPVVTVYAARFDRAPVPDPPRATSLLRIVRDRTVIVVTGSAGPCADAVRSYIKGLPAR